MQDIFVQTSQGRIHLLTAGAGTPLLLLHSNGGSAYEYEHVIDALAERFQVYAWDMPGQGDSDPLMRHMSVREYADAVIEVMDALGIDRAIVSGASIGGAICVALGAHHPQRFERIFVVECPFRSPEEWKGNWHNTEANYAPVTQSREKVAPRLRDATPELMQRWNIDRAKAGSKTCLSVMWALREYDIAADLERFPAGQVLVFGDRSPTVGKTGKFNAVLTDARTHIIENCGHFPMIDDPERFVDIIAQECLQAAAQEK
ncbi:alpha/beta hydrolase [Paracoccus sp. CPCC 101403]|uniref:Alpha/beta hydrolase n=1 Tax=Paracoccus broussonetiae TaxID=3075834 RepID=A0ABU3ELD6_9RHOB|nr:alpha/beta hydrolase [Paracoccus sp. CPCC 101403]MDT1064250.1 alpha/beta hydrolase [Paracoccus sp. CPCC 101403]